MTPAAAPPAAVGRRRIRGGVLAWLPPMAPAVVLFGLFIVGPILWCLYIAFTNAALTGPQALHYQVTGLDNVRALFDDAEVGKAILRTVLFTAGSVAGQNLVGMALAIAMEKAGGVVRAITGTLVVAAWVLPEVVAAFALYAFLGDTGTLNQLLAFLGLGHENWLYTAPMWAIIIGNVWRGTAFSMLVYQAALSDVPSDLVEAAQVDGAGPVRRFVSVTVPVIRRTIGTNLMLTTLQTLALFGLVYIMTKGGPGTQSTTLPIHMYATAFSVGDLGYGSAIALVLLLVGVVFAVVYSRSMREELR